MGIDHDLDGTELAGCQRTQNLNQIQARGVTAEVNVEASRKREHINKPQTMKMNQKGLWVPTHPSSLSNHNSTAAQAPCRKTVPVSGLLTREAGLCALPCVAGRVLSFLCRAEVREGTSLSKVTCTLDRALCGGLALVFPACVRE